MDCQRKDDFHNEMGSIGAEEESLSNINFDSYSNLADRDADLAISHAMVLPLQYEKSISDSAWFHKTL